MVVDSRKMWGKIEYWLRRKLIGNKKDFAEFCWIVKPWRVNLVATAIIVRNNKILLVRPKNRTVFYPPGGLIERDEDPEKACIREVKEELGVKIKIITPLAPTIRWNINGASQPEKQRVLVVFNYLAGITRGKERVVKSDDLGATAEYCWVSLRGFKKLPVLDGVKEGFREGLSFIRKYGY